MKAETSLKKLIGNINISKIHNITIKNIITYNNSYVSKYENIII